MTKELDITLVVRAKHTALHNAAKKVGSQKSLAKLLGVRPSLVSRWVTLRGVPDLDGLRFTSKFRDPVFYARFEKVLFDLTGKTLDELWPPELRRAKDFLATAKVFELTRSYPLCRLADTAAAQRLILPNPSDQAELKELVIALETILKTLPYREREILKLRFGLGEHAGCTHTLEEVGHIFNVSRERVRAIESDTLRHLERMRNVNKLTHFLGD